MIISGALLAIIFGLAASARAAAIPQLLWQTPEDGKSGSAEGQLLGPSAIAVDRASGDVFVADSQNARIDEFDVWGQFVKTWGWGVVASGPDNQPLKNERQEFSVSSMGPSYKLIYFNASSSHNGDSQRQETTQIPSNATAATVQGALEGLESLSPGDVVVSGPSGGPYLVEFVGTYSDTDISPLKVKGAVTETAQTLQDGGSFEVCVPGDGDMCQTGQSGGNHPGELPGLARGAGLAIDGAGHLFVHEVSPGGLGEETSLRVQAFDLQGSFMSMWGGNVDKTTSADLCTKSDLEGGDECGAGAPGEGAGEFQLSLSPENYGSGIAVGPEGHVFVGDIGRIQKFEPSGTYLDEVKVAGEAISSMAMNGSGDFYLTYRSEVGGDAGVKPGIRKLSSTGTLIQTLAAESPGGLRGVRALNVGLDDSLYAAGRLSVAFGEPPPPSIVKFSPAGAEAIGPEAQFGSSSLINGLATGNGCGIDGEDVYATARSEGGGDVLKAYGPPPNPALCPPPARPPLIADSYASSVQTDGAVVRAAINPRFWPDSHYRVEYGTGICSEGGCGLVQPGSPGASLGSRVVNAPVPTQGVFLPGLAPGTTYHYRFVAESEGGGPTVGAEKTFTTFPVPVERGASCPNNPFRLGAATRLPDCRAYEMVSPVDKGGIDAIALQAEPLTHVRATLDQSSVDGEKLTYSTYRAFGDAVSAPFSSQYIATRTASGWESHGISPPRGQLLIETQSLVDTQFKAFSPDLCEGWVIQETDALLAPGAVPGYPDVYRRQNCGPGAGSYEALTTAESSNKVPRQEYLLELQGVSADGAHALLEVPDSLSGGPTPSPGKKLLYETFGGGQMRPVCILPNGTPVTTGCSAGSSSSSNDHGRSQAVSHAISSDGSRIFWSDAYGGSTGKIYVRIKGKQTLAVSKDAEVQSGLENAQYWTAAVDGSRAIFSVGGEGQLRAGAVDLYEFEVDSKTTTLIAHDVFGVLGASEDAKRLYLVSGEALAPGATAGKPNLFFHEQGTGDFTFIATLSAADAEPGSNISFSPANFEPVKHTAQVTPDGEVAVFMSTAPLTGADNTDQASGNADAQVFRYDRAGNLLTCVSCDPTGARPRGHNIAVEGLPFWAASRLPSVQTEIYPISRALSENGKRVFFESFQPLVATDTNGVQDVYEWEEPGEGDCSGESPSFSSLARGCVSLISSGEGSSNSTIVDSDPSGANVFFATQASLVSQDRGLIDIYDARIGGGFPSPPTPATPCEGEACQASSEAPVDPSPASSSFEGPGNVTEKPAHKRKHKKHRQHKKHKKAHHKGKASK